MNYPPIVHTPNSEADLRLQLLKMNIKAVDTCLARLREEKLLHALNAFEAMLTPQGGVIFGLRCAEFERRGFTIVSSTSTPLGKDDKSGAYIMLYTLHVKAPENFLVSL